MNKAKQKTLIILVAALVAVCIAALVVSGVEEYKEKISTTNETIMAYAADEITAFGWDDGTTSLMFRRSGDGWVWDDDAAFPVDAEVIEGLLERYEDFTASFVIENVEDWSMYGLDDPEACVYLTVNEVDYVIKLGDFSKMDEQRYVSVGTEKAYLATSDPLDDLDLAIEDFLLDDEVPDFGDTDEGDVTQVSFVGSTTDAVSIDTWAFAYSDESGKSLCTDDVFYGSTGTSEGASVSDKPLKTTLVTSYLSTIEGLSLDEYVTYNATAEELSAYGLESPELTVNITYAADDAASSAGTEQSTSTFTIHIGRNAAELADALISGEDDAEDDVQAYVRVGDSKIIYTITNATYEKLVACGYNDLRHPEVLTAAFADLTRLDFSIEGETYTLNTTEKDGSTVWTYNDEELTTTALKNAFSGLAIAIFDEETTGKLELSVVAYLDTEKYPSTESVTLKFYRIDGTYCLAVVDGVSVGMIFRSDMVNLIEAVNAIVL